MRQVHKASLATPNKLEAQARLGLDASSGPWWEGDGVELVSALLRPGTLLSVRSNGRYAPLPAEAIGFDAYALHCKRR